jgi:hypothetical protein
MTCPLKKIRAIFNTVSVLEYTVSFLESVVNESVVSHALFMADNILILTTPSFGGNRSNIPVHGSSPMMSNHSFRRYLTTAPLHQHTRPVAIEHYFR